ncbi:MAG: glutathione S-transferase family protein [Pseudomonadales bacterium]
MGLLVNGKWQDRWYDTKQSDGAFVREDAGFRNWVTTTGEAGPTGSGGFKAEPDRYHLFVSLACPWAHRTLIFRGLKKLQDIIAVTVVDPLMLSNGWEFSEVSQDLPIADLKFLHQVYTHAQKDYSGRVTVPVLWDKKQNTIVNNESADIIRMFNSAFNAFTDVKTDYYPSVLHSQIDELNQVIYDSVNNGVYRAGFATTQAAYEEAFDRLFDTLDQLELRLASSRYLHGDTITETDWRLFTTLIRFDAVYFGHFKTNRQLLESYSNLAGFVRDLYQQPGVSETVNFEHIKNHYYMSQITINPTGIVPKGTAPDFSRPHNREL